MLSQVQLCSSNFVYNMIYLQSSIVMVLGQCIHVQYICTSFLRNAMIQTCKDYGVFVYLAYGRDNERITHVYKENNHASIKIKFTKVQWNGKLGFMLWSGSSWKHNHIHYN